MIISATWCRAGFRACWRATTKSPIQRRQRTAATGGLDCQPGQSADGARDGQPHLAASFRRRHRAHAEQLRQTRHAADASRIAGLPGASFRGIRLVDQGDAPRHHAFGDVSAIEHSPARDVEGGPGQSVVRAHEPAAAGIGGVAGFAAETSAANWTWRWAGRPSAI